MSEHCMDIVGRPIQINDFVAFYSNVYKVIGVGKPGTSGSGPVRIKLAEPSKTTKSVVKYSRDMCVIPAADVTLWLLKKGYS
jgi:hypothetical protein